MSKVFYQRIARQPEAVKRLHAHARRAQPRDTSDDDDDGSETIDQKVERLMRDKIFRGMLRSAFCREKKNWPRASASDDDPCLAN
jgi:hypothetical protein